MGVFAAFSGGKIFSGFPGFSAPAEWGARTAAGVFALSGRLLSLHRKAGVRELRQRVRPFRAESFSLNLSGELRSAERGRVRHPPRWAKRKDNLRFSFLFELLPFPCFLIRRRFPICDRCEKGNGRGFFLPCFSQPVRRVRYRSATQAVKFPQARHSSAAQRARTLLRTAPTNVGVRQHLSS